MPSPLSRSSTRLLLVGLALGGAGFLGAQTGLTKPVIGTPTIMPAGPGRLAAGSDYPTHFIVKWTAVSGTSGYRISRWTGADPEMVRTVSASGLSSPTEPGYAVSAGVPDRGPAAVELRPSAGRSPVLLQRDSNRPVEWCDRPEPPEVHRRTG